MKKCARCGSEYADEYDACPKCAKPKRSNGSCAAMIFAIAGIVIALCAISGVVSSCQPDVVSAEQVTSGFASQGVGSIIARVTVDKTTVIVTTTLAPGDAQAAQGLAGYVLATWPAVQVVDVRDFSGGLIQLYKHP